ncbi:MAG: hypothetical protein ACP5N7_05150 [Candidatus Pacearchaeota archaeon]
MNYRLLELRRSVENPNYYLMVVEYKPTLFGLPLQLKPEELEFYGAWGTWRAAGSNELAPKKVRQKLERLLEDYLSSR